MRILPLFPPITPLIRLGCRRAGAVRNSLPQNPSLPQRREGVGLFAHYILFLRPDCKEENRGPYAQLFTVHFPP